MAATGPFQPLLLPFNPWPDFDVSIVQLIRMESSWTRHGLFTDTITDPKMDLHQKGTGWIAPDLCDLYLDTECVWTSLHIPIQDPSHIGLFRTYLVFWIKPGHGQALIVRIFCYLCIDPISTLAASSSTQWHLQTFFLVLSYVECIWTITVIIMGWGVYYKKDMGHP